MKKLVSLLLALAMLLSCTAALADIGTPTLREGHDAAEGYAR